MTTSRSIASSGSDAGGDSSGDDEALVERLHLAETRYRRLVDTLAAIVYTHDLDRRAFTYVSPQIEPILGVRGDEFTPALWEKSLHEEDRERVMEETERTVRTCDPFSLTYRVRARDGRWIWLHDERQVLGDAAGEPIAWQGVMADVTSAKATEQALRASEARFRSVVDNLPAALYMEDPDPTSHGTVFASARIEAITGYDAAEWMSDPDLWLRIVHPDDLDRVLEAERTCVETGATFDLDFRIVRKDGSIVWVNDLAVLINDEDGAPIHWIGFFHDITAKKLADREVARALEVERRSVERLKALDEQKDMFVTATSHEMRTPLAAIMGSARTLEELGDMMDEGDRTALVGAIVTKAAALAKILDDLLDLDRVRRGVLNIRREPVELDQLVAAALDASTVKETHQVVRDTPPIVIFADRAMVERIIENLLTNAGRYTPPGSTIWVRTGRVAGGVGVVVEDDGPGVDPSLREAVFEPFRQGANAVQHAPGIGVGLALVSRFAELHGGKAWFEDREGGGAAFTVLLAPRSAEEAPSRG